MKTTITAITFDNVTVEYGEGLSTNVPVSIDPEQTASEIKESVGKQVKQYLEVFLREKKEEERLEERKKKTLDKLQKLVDKTIRVSLNEDGSPATEEPVANV